MIELNRLGLGTMGMNLENKASSIKTIHMALEKGITLFNTGEFYNGGESELVLGEALKGIDRSSYFVSVKFGVLPDPHGGIYGLDVKPFNIRGHLAYSLKRLGLSYVDLYQPARMDTTIPVEDIMKEMLKLKEEGLIKHVGLSEVDSETLRRAHAICPIDTIEIEYSLVERKIEKELIETARELGVTVLAYGTVGHGLLTNRILETTSSPRMGRGLLAPEHRDHNLAMVKELKIIADEKGVSLSQLSLAWTLSKYPHVKALIGTTNPVHLQEAMDALNLTLTQEDIYRIEQAIPEENILGKGTRNFVFTDGKMALK